MRFGPSFWSENLANATRLFLATCLLIGAAACKSPAERQAEAGRRAMGQGQYREALSIFSEVILQAPDTPVAARAVYDVGVIHYLKLRDLDAARACFRRILDEYPASDVAADARRMLARIYEQEDGELEKAIQEYHLFLEQTSDRSDEKNTLLSVANCYYRLDDLDQASILYRRIIEDYAYDGLSDQAYLRLAHIEALAGRGEETAKIIEALLDRTDQPESRRRAYLLGTEVFLQSRKYGQGRGLLVRADREFPDDPELFDLVDRLTRQEVDGKSLDEGDQESQDLLEVLQGNISWGRGRRSKNARR